MMARGWREKELLCSREIPAFTCRESPARAMKTVQGSSEQGRESTTPKTAGKSHPFLQGDEEFGAVGGELADLGQQEQPGAPAAAP